MAKAVPLILRNANGDAPELWFYEEFGPDYMGCISANAVRQALTDLGGPRKLNIHFNTPGGDVFEASAIYSILKNSGSKITCLIDGVAASCGSWVAMCGDTIRMAENGLMMIHDPETMSYGNEADLLRDAAMLGQVKASILSVYAARTAPKSTADQISTAMSAETWYTANEALAAGLIDEIDPNKASPVTMCVDPRRFRNAPSWIKERSLGTNDWKRICNERRAQLNEIESGAT